jgi:hypothetical protein
MDGLEQTSHPRLSARRHATFDAGLQYAHSVATGLLSLSGVLDLTLVQQSYANQALQLTDLEVAITTRLQVA